MAVTKRLNTKLTTHYNAGYTHLFKEDFFGIDNNTNNWSLLKEKNHGSVNAGFSAIYLVSDSFNLMCEYIYGYNQSFDGAGNTAKSHDYILNPGFRCAFNSGKVQIVPGLGVPLNFSGGKYLSTGLFFYLSIEPNYLAN